jgi:putative membrane protein
MPQNPPYCEHHDGRLSNIHRISDRDVTIHQDTDKLFPVARLKINADACFYLALAAIACVLWWLCSDHISMLPYVAPWDFSWIEFLSAWLVVWWYGRGLVVSAPRTRPSLARRISFVAGVLAFYVVLETHFEYLAEHQFFFNRIQHVILHHFGPLLIALAWPGEMILLGMPRPLRPVVTHPLVVGIVRVLQQPLLAAILFSGSFFFWLIPSVHFHAMIDPNLYTAMNWSMLAEGVLFWCLVLDPRPSPPARTSFAVRATLAVAVMFPQIIGGAMIAFTKRDLYTFYDLCGRIYPNLGAHVDQTVGGLIVWIPPAMMSVLALLLVLHMLFRADEQNAKKLADKIGQAASAGCPVIDASQWTGL